MRVMYILAGANGSGKSTIASVLLPTKSIVYVNPDDIARELNPADLTAVKIEAGKVAVKRVRELVTSGESFAIESTLSGNGYVKVIKEARETGYKVVIAYAFVDSPDMCIARIAARVKNGGHHVPDEDVVRRYYRSKGNFMNVYAELADECMIFYNGESEPILIADKSLGGEMRIYSDSAMKLFMEGICLKQQPR